MTFPAIDGNSLGVNSCGVLIDPVTIPLLLNSTKWLSNPDLYDGDIEDVYETVQAFESLSRRLMSVTPDCEALSVIPVGSIQAYMGVTAPDGWLMCDGSLISDTNYPGLASVLGVTGSFYLPDMRGRFPLGANGLIGAVGGEATHTLTLSEIPAHLHTVNAHTHTIPAHNHTASPHTHTQDSHNHSFTTLRGNTAFGSQHPALGNLTYVSVEDRFTSNVAPTIQASTITINDAPSTVTGSTGSNTDVQGSGTAHNNMPPYLAVNFIIKT